MIRPTSRDSRHWLPDVKFSPDGQSFALGSMDHKIYLYNAETFRLKGTCDRHNGAVMDFDFSTDSVYIQSDSSDNEHLYFEAEDGSFFSAGSQLKDIKWHDWTCKYGWPMQGLFKKYHTIISSTLYVQLIKFHLLRRSRFTYAYVQGLGRTLTR